MNIIVHDTVSLLEPLYTQPTRPKERLARSLDIFTHSPELASLPIINKECKHSTFHIMAAVQKDGYDVMVGQQRWGLFDPGRKLEASLWQFQQFKTQAVLQQISTYLTHFASIILTSIPSNLECLLVPADPANHNLMIMNHGFSAFADIPGYLLLEIWPATGNLQRLGPLLARLFIHNIRTAYTTQHTPAISTLADILILEGLSSIFIDHMFPHHSTTPWLTTFQQPKDWSKALQSIAHFHNVSSYEEMNLNIYGMRFQANSAPRPPVTQPMDTEEHTYAYEVILEALTTTNPHTIAAYMYGDELIALQGHPTVGLPPYAGFEIAHKVVNDYLQQSHHSIHDIIGLPTQEFFKC